MSLEVVRLPSPIKDDLQQALSCFDCVALHDLDGQPDPGEIMVRSFLVDGEAEIGVRDGTGTTYFAIDREISTDILGYITLSFSQIKLTNGEKRTGSVEGRRGIFGALRIAMIATSKDFTGRGIGTFLVDYAMGLAVFASQRIATVRFLIVDAAYTQRGWYERRGFTENRSADEVNRLNDVEATSMRLDLGVDLGKIAAEEEPFS